MSAGEAATLRLDKWLWFARLTKSRSLAARLCEAGAVAIAGRATLKPHHPVRIGDVVTVPQGRLIRTVHVAALGTRRGPATEARQLYLEPNPPHHTAADWTPLLREEEGELHGDPASFETRPTATPQDERNR
jgi:ribosomal 50S subunit-recycling heat shock protein